MICVLLQWRRLILLRGHECIPPSDDLPQQAKKRLYYPVDLPVFFVCQSRQARAVRVGNLKIFHSTRGSHSSASGTVAADIYPVWGYTSIDAPGQVVGSLLEPCFFAAFAEQLSSLFAAVNPASHTCMFNFRAHVVGISEKLVLVSGVKQEKEKYCWRGLEKIQGRLQ